MNKPYIFESSQNKNLENSDSAIIVMPDIYGQSEYAKKTIEDFATKYQQPAFLLDYFYELTHEANVIAQDDQARARELMDQMNGEKFERIFATTLNEISTSYPNIKNIVVVGFCFAGRLAYITGFDKRVNKIISFYGAGAHLEGFINNQTAIEYLVSNRAGDPNLYVYGFYGIQDESIPKTDRDKTKAELGKAQINYKAFEYDCGHAYFQPGRANYNEKAARQSWDQLDAFIEK